MKKLYEFQVSELLATKAAVKQIEKLLTDYSRTGKFETLLAAQENIHKVEQTVAAAIKSARPATASSDGGELDWDALPIKAPLFILNLARKYPQKEQKYFDAWKALITKHAPNPGEKANYGKYINMFKAYAKRPEYDLALEDVDFDAEIARYNEVNESAGRKLSNIKMFEDFDMDDENMDDDIDTDEDDGPPYYFFIDGDNQAIVKIDKGMRGGSYRETLVRGEEPYGFGSKTYQSYLSADDIESWLRKDYGDVTRIKEEEFDDYLPEE